MSPEVEFLDFIVKNLVTNYAEAKITKVEDDLGILLNLSVAKEDMGLIIGKSGATVTSIRSLLRILGRKTEQRITLKVLD